MSQASDNVTNADTQQSVKLQTHVNLFELNYHYHSSFIHYRLLRSRHLSRDPGSKLKLEATARQQDAQPR